MRWSPIQHLTCQPSEARDRDNFSKRKGIVGADLAASMLKERAGQDAAAAAIADSGQRPLSDDHMRILRTSPLVW